MNILDEIISEKRKEVERRIKITSVEQLQDADLFNRNGISLSGKLKTAGASGIIAEFKRRSPSKGIINDKVSPVDVARAYEAAGATGMSILTDTPFFGGSSADLMDVRRSVDLPLLRKDFIIDPYQVYESKAMGADVILLIAANLKKEQCRELALLAQELDLEVLLELHSEDELDHINNAVSMVGVNNRDLKTFKVDLEHSINLCGKIDDGFVKIAESGLSSIENIHLLQNNGFLGFLIGEYFMKESDPGNACRELINKL